MELFLLINVKMPTIVLINVKMPTIVGTIINVKMPIIVLINVKMPTIVGTIVGILTFMSKKNSILGLSESKKLNFLVFLYL